MQISLVSGKTQFPWIIILIFFIHPSFCDPRVSEAALLCGDSRVLPSSFIPLFTSEMSLLSQRVAADHWGNLSRNSDGVAIFSLAQCHSDLSHNDCLLCFAASRSRLPRCIPSVSGRVFLDGCFLRYDNYSFYEESVDPVLDRVNCNSSVGVSDRSDLNFVKNAAELIDNLTSTAVVSGGFAVDGIKGVFGLAECWNTVGKDGCKACLEKAKTEVKSCFPSLEGRALNAGCYLRYSNHKFFSNNSDSDGGSGISKAWKSVAIALPVIFLCMLSLFAGYTVYRRWRRRQQELKNLGKMSYSYNKSNVNFKYETLEKATNYFADSRKLGQGGAGSVYKGTLPNGTTVAVKRLFFSTKQWVDEFFNEVNLISGIEHKNLVKLLGCSIEGPESLLVYEFVPNESLEQYIKNKVKVLTWKERHKIIVGTAEGIAFLHGGFAVRIIHRDIKSSNIILDENFEPKIADFGLARHFADDKTHLSTGIAGTLGYMAPEYLVKGQLTEKSDIYSFGVLVLEIVSGKKINAFDDDAGSLLKTVWKLYKTDRLAETVDPLLVGDFPVSEAYRVVKIGLLCTQASVSLRPSMLQVVQMLVNEDADIPEPNQPPFLNTGLPAENSVSSQSWTTFTATKPDASCSSGEFFS